MYEAWGMPHPDEASRTRPSSPVVSAKKVQLIERELATSSIRGDLKPESKAMNDKEEVHEGLSPQILEYMEVFVEEIDRFRNDNVRRNLVYMSVVGIFFAIMIMYIERLNRQINNLNNILHLHHLQSSSWKSPGRGV